MEKQEIIGFMLNNVLMTVIFFICFLSFILIFSLMQTDVEERRYEFAVLRTLGMRNHSLITLITIQTLIFAVPAIMGGFILQRILIYVTEHSLGYLAGVNIHILIMSRTYLMGIVVGLFIPFLSNIVPI